MGTNQPAGIRLVIRAQPAAGRGAVKLIMTRHHNLVRTLFSPSSYQTDEECERMTTIKFGGEKEPCLQISNLLLGS